MTDRPISVIVFRPGGRSVYYAQWVDRETGKKKTKSTGTSIKRDAERFAGKLQDQLNNGAVLSKRIKWAEFRKRVEKNFLPEKRKSTQDNYHAAMVAAETHLKPGLLSGLTTETLTELRVKLRESGKADATVACYLRHLKALLRWGHRQGLLATIPHIDFSTFETAPRGRSIVGEEFERLLLTVPKVVGEDRAASWCYLLRGLYLGGLRIGEACKLSWDDAEGIRVDLERARPLLYIPGKLQKGKRDSVVPLVPDFADLLRETPPEARTGLVFKPKSSKVETLSQRQIEKTITDIGRKAGIVTKREPLEFVTAHDLRRSFCFRWAQRILPQHLRVLARHKSIETTLRFYSESDADQTADAVAAALANYSANTPDIGKQANDVNRVDSITSDVTADDTDSI